MSLKAGIIGAGGRAQAHLKVLGAMEDIHIAGIADVDRQKAAAACAQFGGTAYDDFEAMMDREQPDAVYVVVPYFLHRELALPIVARKVPLFIEKPVSNSLADAVAIAGAVERAGLITAVGYQWRYLDGTERAVELLADRPVGMVTAQYIHGRPNTSWSAQGRLSGGQILAQLTHHLDLARFLAGDVETVYAQRTVRTRPELRETGNWDNWSVTARFKSGALGSFWSTYSLFPGLGTLLEVIAAERLITINMREMTVTEREGKQTYPYAVQGEARMHRAFADAVRRGDPAGIRSTVADALLSGLISYAATASAESGEPVALDALLARARHDAAAGQAG
jgi:predicted dehydrogenase